MQGVDICHKEIAVYVVVRVMACVAFDICALIQLHTIGTQNRRVLELGLQDIFKGDRVIIGEGGPQVGIFSRVKFHKHCVKGRQRRIKDGITCQKPQGNSTVMAAQAEAGRGTRLQDCSNHVCGVIQLISLIGERSAPERRHGCGMMRRMAVNAYSPFDS